MLGDKIGEAKGRTTSTRLLPFDWSTPRIEASFTGDGVFLGCSMTIVGTYWEGFREDGGKFGDARMLFTFSNNESVYFRGSGVSANGARYASFGDFPWATQSFARAKNMGVVLEYDILEKGEYAWRMWEWR
jgi:hypothetical protein